MSNEFDDIPADQVPQWLNDDFFTPILAKVQGDATATSKSKIISIKPAVNVGENFVANLFRVVVQTVSAPVTTHSFILKFANSTANGIMANYPVFRKEIKIYRDFLPSFQSEFHRSGEEVQFGPKCYLSAEKPVEILVLDDLNVQGYLVQDRYAGLDMDHSRVVLAKLAKYHAGSAVHHEKYGSFGDDFNSLYRGNLEQMTSNFINGSFKYFMETIRKNEILNHLVDKIEKWQDVAIKELLRVTTADPNAFNVLNHGDVWTNNYLFLYDGDNCPKDVLLIDYQIAVWATPVIDLYYFFVTSTNALRNAEFDDLVHFYHGELIQSLTSLGYGKNKPTLKDLHIDLLNDGFMACFGCFMFMAIVLLEPRADANMATIMTECDGAAAVKEAMFTNSRYVKRLEIFLPFLERRGLLDV